MNELIKERKAELEKTKQDLINNYQKEISEINEIIKLVESCDLNKDDNIDTIVFKLYLVFNSVTKVSHYINDLGYRIKTNSKQGERKYNSNDITEIIKNKEADVNLSLKEVVQKVQKSNYRKAAKRWF